MATKRSNKLGKINLPDPCLLGDGILVFQDFGEAKRFIKKHGITEPYRWEFIEIATSGEELRPGRLLRGGYWFVGCSDSIGLCKVCRKINECFNEGLPGKVCDGCLAERTAILEPDPLVNIRRWYAQRGFEMSKGKFELDTHLTGSGKYPNILSCCDPLYDLPVIWRMFDERCAYCGSRRDCLTIDHIVPQRHGGHDVPQNLAPACSTCNSSKCDRPVSDFLKSRVAYRRERIEKLRELNAPDEILVNEHRLSEAVQVLHNLVLARLNYYRLIFGGLTETEIAEIKHPVICRMRPPQSGQRYVFTGPDPIQKGVYTLRYGDCVKVIGLPKPLHDFHCFVRTEETQQEFTVSWHLLRFPRNESNEWWCY